MENIKLLLDINFNYEKRLILMSVSFIRLEAFYWGCSLAFPSPEGVDLSSGSFLDSS
jgi:hypothetical protein